MTLRRFFAQFRHDCTYHSDHPSWLVMSFFFCLVRRLVVERVDPNEDYNCGECGKPVLRRYLFCSAKCSEAFESRDFASEV